MAKVPTVATDVVDVSELGSTGLVGLNADTDVGGPSGPTVVLSTTIDDWEDADLVPSNGDWSQESTSGNPTTTTNTVIKDTTSLKFPDDDNSDTVEYKRASAITPQEIAIWFRADQQPSGTSDYVRLSFKSGTTRFISIFFELTGDVHINATGNPVVGTWSIDTNYQLHIKNIDYGAETFDVTVTSEGGTEIVNETGNSFENSVSDFNRVSMNGVYNFSTNDGGANSYLDDLQHS